MRITASTRPRGLKKGLTTKKFYRDFLGYKKDEHPDIRDTVGKLELSATCGNDTLLFASLFRLFGRYDLGQEAKLVIYDKDGEMLIQYERNLKAEPEVAA
jgi:hypothetical protein